MMHDEPILFQTVMGELLKIQNLEIILLESKIIHQDNIDFAQPLADLENKINQLKAKIPDDILAQFHRLRRQAQVAIAKVSSTGKCTSCHVTIPVGSLQQMAGERLTPTCPNCSRYLYVW